MAGLSHPNIVQVFDAGQEGRLVFLVMEFLAGSTLAGWIDERVPCDPGALLPLVVPVGRALSFVHARGLVHRDVKPDNVFLVAGEDGGLTPKVLDFGIARPVSQEGARSITATGAILGTPAYMAPEQAWGLKEITPAADQWAFAAMIYEALCGEIPHNCETPYARIVRRVSEAPRPLREVAPGVDVLGPYLLPCKLKRDQVQSYGGQYDRPLPNEPSSSEPHIRLWVFSTDC